MNFAVLGMETVWSSLIVQLVNTLGQPVLLEAYAQ